MKKVSLFLVMVLASVISFAQHTVTYTVGVEAGLPTTNTFTSDVLGLGASVQAECRNADSKLGYTLGLGYLNFLSTKNGLKDNKNYQVPVLAGARLHVTDKVFVGGEAGVRVFQMFEKNSSTYFTFSPSIGYQLGKFNVTGKYVSSIVDNNWAAGSNLGLRLGYNF